MKQGTGVQRAQGSRLLRAVAVAASLVLALGACSDDDSSSGGDKDLALTGRVESSNGPLANYKVAVYGSFSDKGAAWTQLGTDTTASDGSFTIRYSLSDTRKAEKPVLFVQATSGSAMLASAIGTDDGQASGKVVVNDRTTVATGNAYAQFISATGIAGDAVGMRNAAQMAANLADPLTGAIGTALASSPNGDETSTQATFNSLANVVAACVASQGDCTKLFAAATPAGGKTPADVLQALSNLVKSPSYPGYPDDAADPIFLLAQGSPAHYLGLTARPTNWLLFLKTTGGAFSTQSPTNYVNGVGNIAFDAQGYAWANDNYEPQYAGQSTCAGLRLLKFSPAGQVVAGSPYYGGGLSGAGFGITLDPTGNIWTGNFGFEDPPCIGTPKEAPHNSVSAFQPDGTPISPSTGYTQGKISWPQGTTSDRAGNIWLANCGNDSVTKIPHGDPTQAINIPLATLAPGALPNLKPFGAVVDLDGNVWITTNRGNTMVVLSPDGAIIDTLTNAGADPAHPLISHPIGNAVDSTGNVWIANSDWLDAPCPDRSMVGPASNPSITLYQRDNRQPYPGSPFTGGGLTVPWGISVDGNDTVWVFNFGPDGVGVTPTTQLTGVSRFCGTDTSKCPAGMKTGDPISPATGYTSNALERITGGQIDRSGNLWLMNNWKQNPNPDLNPGANSMTIAIGAAAPLNTPVIGPPVPLVAVVP
ncbi:MULTISPECIES: hypothetical protein [unclassified Achromobacter]|uniref:hypothetical protein n=1 Tax=unclassified Achromobacter TaxID=2626865 RepID=UPI000B518FE2|nr:MULTISPECIES: hypothetical protein [unclassified Achromobacter]OWT68183.1 hypothetical protein CEY05_29615 [Achromobacter sp. HZ34]OWT70020.1 hypothetical protein CEY04_28445 [Achromobacter sp. HZ28]